MIGGQVISLYNKKPLYYKKRWIYEKVRKLQIILNVNY